jgi:predicted PurR-regulated permease PerM
MFGLDLKAARATWTVIAILILCLTVYAIRSTLFIFIVALLFAYLLLPIVDIIDRFLPMKRSRGPALAIVYTLLVTSIVMAGIEVGSSVALQANNLAENFRLSQTGPTPFHAPASAARTDGPADCRRDSRRCPKSL